MDQTSLASSILITVMAGSLAAAITLSVLLVTIYKHISNQEQDNHDENEHSEH